FNAPASTSPLHTFQQQALGAVNAPVQTLTGRPLIGNGTPGAAGSGAAGTAGGWVFGDGGADGSGAMSTGAPHAGRTASPAIGTGAHR
ncbi:PE family protein, partial [Mycobacterium ulcerans]